MSLPSMSSSSSSSSSSSESSSSDCSSTDISLSFLYRRAGLGGKGGFDCGGESAPLVFLEGNDCGRKSSGALPRLFW